MMGKSGKRRRAPRRAGRDRVRAIGAVSAANVDGAAVDAVRQAVALITALRSSPDDLPDLLLELGFDPLRQALVANGLLSRFAMTALRDLAETAQTTLVDAFDRLLAGIPVEETQDRSAWDGALRTARTYAEVLDGVRHPEAVAEELGKSLGSGLSAVGLIVVLTQLTVAAVEARCDALGESTTAYLQRLALPTAEAHGNAIDAGGQTGVGREYRFWCGGWLVGGL